MDEKVKAPDKFRRELENLKEQLNKLAVLAQAALDQSIEALMTRNPNLAREVIRGDKVINDLEEELDADCVRLIALYQPVAIDLRQVMAIDHLIVELERLGDLAVNVAEEALNLEQLPPADLHRDLPRMTRMVQGMLRDSLSGLPRPGPHPRTFGVYGPLSGGSSPGSQSNHRGPQSRAGRGSRHQHC
jgi:phosphate transport system protein